MNQFPPFIKINCINKKKKHIDFFLMILLKRQKKHQQNWPITKLIKIVRITIADLK